MTFQEENLTTALGTGEISIICIFSGYYKIFESPLKVKSINFYGNSAKTHKFVEYIDNIFSKNSQKYKPEMKD